MNIGIVGIGLIGGSIARDLSDAGHTIYGHDSSDRHLALALENGLIERAFSIHELAKNCDAIFVSIPVDQAPSVVISLLDQIKWSGIVIDTGSTKSSICNSVRSHTKRGRFVASHPLAGTEYSGPNAALSGLYADKKNIICEEHLTHEDALDTVIELMNEMKMQTLFMNPDDHDKHMAYVSHLSHVSAFMLGSTVLNIEKDQKQIVNLASTGFKSTVRLAKSSPVTWSSIFMDNAENITTALDTYISHLTDFKQAIESGNREEVVKMMDEANDIKRVLSGMKYNIVKLS